MTLFDYLYAISLHSMYANTIPVICRTIEETIVFIGVLLFLYKMFTLFDFKYESDITYKDKPSDNYIWKIETKEPVQKEENTDGKYKPESDTSNADNKH